MDGGRPEPEIFIRAMEGAGDLGRALEVESLWERFLARIDRPPLPEEHLTFARALDRSHGQSRP